MNIKYRFADSTFSVLAAFLLTLCGGLSAPVYAGTVDLSPTPPDLTTSVDPNIVVTFDDSGSMMATAMPDAIAGYGYSQNRDYYYSATSNLVYYDPNITYTPASKPDGTSFPNASYKNAWRDGMCANWSGSYCYGSARTTDLSDEFYNNFANGTSTGSTSNSNGQWDIPKARRGGNTQKGGFYFDCPTKYSDTGCTRVEMNSSNVTDAQRQNFANWYSYYRTRNLMARTAMSRAFGNLGENIRVAWQTINHDQTHLDNSAIKSLAGSWRKDYFDWLYSVHTTGGTPDRHATIRAGKFFERGATYDDKDPYWNGLSGDDKGELSCRQNFHMLVTDGYWNEGDPGMPSNKLTTAKDHALKDGRSYSTSDAESKIFWNVSGTDYESSMANIAWTYWANDLRPDLDDNVPPYITDTSTMVTGSTAFDPTAAPPANNPLNNKEIYWNPANDPATWQHVVQFMITLGIAGDRAYPDDYDALRTGSKDWPHPKNNSPEAVDDTWHAAINSRGSYFSASNPSELVTHLTDVINSIASRTGSAVANTVNSGVITSKSDAYTGLFNSTSWDGSVKAHKLILNPIKDPVTGRIIKVEAKQGAELWDADCLLTGGGCKSGGTKITTARKPSERVILTSSAVGKGNGVGFAWDNLSASEQRALNASPSINSSSSTIISDGLGSKRVDWLRGDRTEEGATMRTRASVMGAVIRSQPLYVSYPDDGYRNVFPAKGSGTTATVAPENAKPYEKFVDDHKKRTPTLYVGANDGMLHAFNAETGKELFAYVPASVYWQSQPVVKSGNPDKPGIPELSKLTARTGYQFTPTVDNTPVKRDVFFNKAWHTLLVGTLGMGGRGVYALDITKDPTSVTEATAGATVLWEFNPSVANMDSNLGYTFGQAAISRLANGKWVVLVPGGYFPKSIYDPNHFAAPASRNYSSLFVLDAEDGSLIRELKTSDADTGSSVTSFGLTTPVLGDYQDDQVDDVAFAGDLAGNLWRYDLTDEDKDNWSIDLVFKGDLDKNGDPTQPITAKPRLFPDPITNNFIVLFGTGKYLGKADRLRSGTPTQAIYGIRERGSSSDSSYPASYYPVDHDKLVQQIMVRDGTNRFLSNKTVPAGKTGWYIDLDVRQGERVVQRAGALFSSNQALITTLIPGGDDPCNPNREGAQILLDAATGGSGGGIESLKDNAPDKTVNGEIVQIVGVEFPPPTSGGGGGDTLPSTGDSGSVQPVLLEPGGCRGIAASGLNIPMPCWRRRSWQRLDQ
ncbi:MAG: PilC/PilY family type IV pilus protein [Rhodanobacteraceae bacterium]